MTHVEPPPDLSLVRALLAAQHPTLAALPLRRAGAGMDNTVLRLGEDWLVRLPRSDMAARLLANELRWLPVLAPELPLPVPVPSFIGQPQGTFIWPWYVAPWFSGRPAMTASLRAPSRTAAVLAAFLRALHRPAPQDAPYNPYRSIPLAVRGARVIEQLAHPREGLKTHEAARLRELWSELAHADPPAQATLLHGDLHPGNLLIHEGELAAVIDFGDVCAGDPATDLSVAWMLFEREDRDHFRAHSASPDDDALWQRAKGWALALSLAAFSTSQLPAALRAAGLRSLRRILDPQHH